MLRQVILRASEVMESGPYPERPGEPDCAYYIRTGLCRFGMTCRYNHPPNQKLGEPLCVFYSRYGICKFGPNCKFDHPMVTPVGFAYNLSPPSADTPVVRRSMGSSSGPPTLTLPSEGSAERSLGKSRRMSLPESRQRTSGDENTE